jgi:hypothetical protein
MARSVRSSCAATARPLPGDLLGLPRCVFVEWTPGGVDVRAASGQPCTGLFTTLPDSAGS